MDGDDQGAVPFSWFYVVERCLTLLIWAVFAAGLFYCGSALYELSAGFHISSCADLIPVNIDPSETAPSFPLGGIDGAPHDQPW